MYKKNTPVCNCATCRVLSQYCQLHIYVQYLQTPKYNLLLTSYGNCTNKYQIHNLSPKREPSMQMCFKTKNCNFMSKVKIKILEVKVLNILTLKHETLVY